MAELDCVILEHLHHIRGALDEMRDDIREIIRSAGHIETHHANMSDRLDRMDMRIDRIERRLDLTDA
jgi:hypothetical protein